MSYELKMKLLMHLVCIAQWGVFALIHWEMLGKGKWKHPFACTVLALCGMLVISLWIDLVIVVSNLLNNAIEAAAQAAPPEVHVRMKKTEGELVISVRNRVRQNVEIPEGQLPRSTKREPGHGMGLANVCAVLEAHNAEYTLSCRDNWFRFTCAFPTNGI